MDRLYWLYIGYIVIYHCTGINHVSASLPPLAQSSLRAGLSASYTTEEFVTIGLKYYINKIV